MRTIRLLISSPTLIILVFGLSFQETHGFLSGKDRVKSSDLPLEIQDERALELIEKANELREKKKYGNAIETYKQIYKKYPVCSFAPEAYYQIGDIHMLRKDYKKAFESYNFAVIRHPDFSKFNEVLDKLFIIAERTMNSKSGQYFFLFKFYNYDLAIQYFETIVGNAPYSDYAPKSLMRIAFMHRTQGDQPEAIDALDRLINFYSNSEVAPDAYLALADTFSSMVAGPDYDQGATREAISYYRDFLILFPSSDLVTEGEEKLADIQDVHAQSKFIIGEYYFKRRSNYRAAEVFFNDAITVSPNSPTALQARNYLNKIDTLKPEIDIEDDIIVAQEDGESARLKLLISDNNQEKTSLENENKKLLRLGIFNKSENSEGKPAVFKKENPITIAEKNMDSAKLPQDIEDPVEDFATNEEEKPTFFRLFNNNDKTADTEEKLASKEGRERSRFKLFNRTQELEDNLVSPNNEIHLGPHNKEKNN